MEYSNDDSIVSRHISLLISRVLCNRQSASFIVGLVHSYAGSVFTNAVVDRVAFDKSDMQGVQFINTVLSGSTFEGANLEGASFENALIGYVDIQKLCKNPTLPEESRIDLACKP